ncbi:hypothetical protein L0657_04055 [Dyadobacter sp. CY345]|uniref:hypothetical protein n=1 Tax=Dyadobacter sp. CY345 TaxID=2909335 RepID=UPI001F38E077|nr:hypothetical protein [Dyadobacter sp. CY345]MCF2443121.1 hypothetical protein [Dyadobacter sp. CY345]
MKKWIVFMGLIMAIYFVACNNAADPLPITFFDSTFQEGTDDWTGDFAYYESGQDSAVNFNISLADIPFRTDSTLRGLRVEGTNTGDSLFWFIKRKITGLDPTLTYKVAYRINLSTSYPDTVGSSGRLTHIKAGASTEEPKKVLSSGYYNTSILKGTFGRDGKEMLVLGNAGNRIDSVAYRSIVRDNANLAVEVKPNAAGEIWLCVGTETKYKGKILLFFDRIYAAVSEKRDY